MLCQQLGGMPVWHRFESIQCAALLLMLILLPLTCSQVAATSVLLIYQAGELDEYVAVSHVTE
jgi:hypothetical protein